jgi:outer membrane protein
MYKQLFTLALASSVLLGQPAWAQDPAPSPSPAMAVSERPYFLTLTEAIETAFVNNHDIQLARQRIDDARLQITETGAQGLPQLSVNASYGRQDPISSGSLTDTGSGGGAGAGLGSNPQLAAFLGLASVNTFQSRVTLSQTLFAGFRIVDGVRLAQINVGMMEEGLRSAQQNVAFQVSSAYFNALRAWEVVRIDRETLSQAQAQVAQAESRIKSGVGVKLDLLQAQSQVLQIQQGLSRDVNTFEKAKMNLNLVMGREADQPLELNTAAQVQPYDKLESQSLEQAIENRADLRQLLMQREMQELNASIQGRSVWPTVTAQAVYSLQDNQVVNGNNNNIQNINYSLNMNWPVFDGLAASAKAQRAQQSALQAKTNYDQLRQKAVVEVKQAYLDIREANERFQLAQAGVQVAKENLRVAEISYREGVSVSINVIDAQVRLQQARNSLITAQFDIHTSMAKLYQVLGLDLMGSLR